MSEQELNAYRFISGEEPSDEMLAQIMSEVASEARESNKRASDDYQASARERFLEKKKYWDRLFKTLSNE